jgi:hypothetical protein
MSQTTISDAPALGIVGQQADAGPFDAISAAAAEPIEFGRFVAYGDTNGLTVRKPLQNSLQIVFDADLVTSNTINGSIKYRQINTTDFTNTAIAQVTFSVNHLTTMGLLEAQAELNAGVLSATVGGASNRTLTILAKEGYEIEVGTTAWVVAAGGSQAGVTYVRGTTDSIIGVSLHQNVEADSSNVAQYKLNDAVNVLTKGRVWFEAQETVTTSDSVFAQFVSATAERGELRITADSAPVEAIATTNTKLRSSGAASGLVILEINQP